MLPIILLIVAIASFSLTFAARKIKGYADGYYIPRTNISRDMYIHLKPVRYVSFVIGFISIYFSLASALHQLLGSL
jgi:hypothetical protein